MECGGVNTLRVNTIVIINELFISLSLCFYLKVCLYVCLVVSLSLRHENDNCCFVILITVRKKTTYIKTGSKGLWKWCPSIWSQIINVNEQVFVWWAIILINYCIKLAHRLIAGLNLAILRDVILSAYPGTVADFIASSHYIHL